METEDVFRFIDPYSLLVMTPTKLVRLYCPFRVELIHSIPPFSEGDIVFVTKIMHTHDKQMVYIIEGRAYACRLFRIIV